jgi:hypothetical protein
VLPLRRLLGALQRGQVRAAYISGGLHGMGTHIARAVDRAASFFSARVPDVMPAVTNLTDKWGSYTSIKRAMDAVSTEVYSQHGAAYALATLAGYKMVNATGGSSGGIVPGSALLDEFGMRYPDGLVRACVRVWGG